MMGGSQSTPQYTGDNLLEEIPDDLLIEILVRVPAEDIVQNCARVSKRMRDIISSQTLWRKKCEIEGKYIHGVIPFPNDFKRLYFFHPYTRNLIRNPCGLEGLNHWDILQNGGNEFKVQTSAKGSQKFEDTNIKEEWSGPLNAWATSYGACEKRQIIDLVDEGIDPVLLDEIQPPIHVSEWYAARFDCACHYDLEVKLLTRDNKKVDSFTHTDDIPAWTSAEWTKIQHTFTKYGQGVRRIEFRHLGKDKQFWAGHYGPKFTLSTVKFIFEPKS